MARGTTYLAYTIRVHTVKWNICVHGEGLGELFAPSYLSGGGGSCIEGSPQEQRDFPSAASWTCLGLYGKECPECGWDESHLKAGPVSPEYRWDEKSPRSLSREQYKKARTRLGSWWS